jgi:hypothetical protein
MSKDTFDFVKDGNEYKLIRKMESWGEWFKEVPLASGSIGLHFFQSRGTVTFHKDIIDPITKQKIGIEFPTGTYRMISGCNLLAATSGTEIHVVPVSPEIREIKVIPSGNIVSVLGDGVQLISINATSSQVLFTPKPMIEKVTLEASVDRKLRK